MNITEEELKESGYIDWKWLPDGELIAVSAMLFNNGRLYMDVNRNGYEDFYCFDSVEQAKKSMAEYDPNSGIEPQGWKRHYSTGRRRPGGDPTKEFVNY